MSAMSPIGVGPGWSGVGVLAGLFGAGLVVALGGCASRPAPRPGPALATSTPASTPTGPASARASAPVGGDRAPDAAAPNAAAAAVSTVELVFTRELEVPIRSIALGERRVAVLGDVPHLKDRGRWQPIPLPARLAPQPGAAVTIYMGRDDRPRLMGHTTTDAPKPGGTAHPIYLRYLDRGWVKAYEEIGRLGGDRPGALFGVLGYEDPEVVCKERELCLVKRRTGWTSIAVPELGPIRLTGDAVFGLFESGVSRLGPDGFGPAGLALPAGEVRDLWEVAPGEVWAILATPAKVSLVHLSATGAAEVAAPIAGPEVLWAAAPDDLWIAGAGGLGHFDGRAFRRVLGLEGSFVALAGKSREEVWVGGSSGLFHHRREAGARDPAD